MAALVKPALSNVSPGQPVTAQAWNAVVGAVGPLYDAILAMGTGIVQVTVQSGGQPLSNAVVVAVPNTGSSPPVLAVPPHGTVTTYTLGGLTDGGWSVFASAPGFPAVASQVATLPGQAPMTFNLTTPLVAMPDLFNRTAADALTTLTAAGIQVQTILDAFGKAIPSVSLPADHQSTRVIAQVPAPGTMIDPATARANLVLAAQEVPQTLVTMPDLYGLTYAQAGTVLNNLGLRIGRTFTQSS